MRRRFLTSLPLMGLLALGIAPQARGEMPQEAGRRPTPMPMPGRDASIPRSPDGMDARPLSPTGGRRAFPSPPAGRPPILRPSYRRLAPSTGVVYLPDFPRCTVIPTLAYWDDREYDIMAAIQRQARKGYIPVTPFPADQDQVTGTSMVGSGWRAYGFLVPAGGQILLKLAHPKPGWFRVYWVDQWGQYRPGMMVKPGEPEALYTNSGKGPVAVYAIVDDPGQWATAGDPFTLTAKRNFDAAHMDAQGVTVHTGIWNTVPDSYWMAEHH